MKNYPKGSEWRRWDLHVHSPASHNFSGNWPQFLKQLSNADCEVIGINDYFSVAGYRLLQKILNNLSNAEEAQSLSAEEIERLNTKIFFPIVECRMSEIVIVKGSKGTKPRINFHLVFDSHTDIQNVENFIKSLNVEGAALSSRYDNAEFLFQSGQVSLKETIEALENDSDLVNTYLLWLPYDEHGGIDPINPDTDHYLKQKLIKTADIIGSSNGKQIDFFHWKDSKYTKEQYANWFSVKKPCIKGSDSHNHTYPLGHLKDSNSEPIEKYCWVKAVPSFEGLRQIIHEPEGRVYIGEKPDKLQQDEADPTKIINHIKIAPINAPGENYGWFNSELYLNSGLVAIIGNKGSGKSALADILALAGNSKCKTSDYSFLNNKKFLAHRYAEKFEAQLTWCDSSENKINLSSNNNALVEQVIYLPQSQLERICADPSSDSFQEELERVIFSRLNESQKAGRENFKELMNDRAKGHQEKIDALRRRIIETNKEIVKYENYLSKDFKVQIESSLTEKRRELDAHEANKPREVYQPISDSSDATDVEAKRTELKEIIISITAHNAELTKIESEITLSRNLLKKAENFAESFARLQNETRSDFKKLLVSFDEVIKFDFHSQPLKRKLMELESRKKEVVAMLNPNQEGSIEKKKLSLETELEKLQKKLDEPNQKYQKYLAENQAWEERKLSIEGEGEVPLGGTIKNLEQWVNHIKNSAPRMLEEGKNSRKKLASDILLELQAIIRDRDELYAPVKNMITDNKVVEEGFAFGFDSLISEKGFSSEFFDYIKRGHAGSFCGIDESEKLLGELMDGIDFGNVEQLTGLLEKIDQHLHSDMRQGKDEVPTIVANQLRGEKTVESLYDFIWSLEYLNAELALKLDGKPIDQLSPGERGSLLLVFYLLLDESRIPIIVDQPEENLDNQTVVKLLVPIIKDAKQRRQVIMVTHNPNIAVVCDAEQVIHSEIDKANNNKVTYTSGAIETLNINRHLVDVLEGTQPAFDNRRQKYIQN